MRKIEDIKQLHTKLFIGLAICITILLSACSQDSQSTQSQSTSTYPGTPTMQTVIMDASWAHIYHDLSSLKHDSDLAVEGIITGVAKVIQDNKGIVSTLFVFTISRVLWNPHSLAQNASLIINQTGGVINGNVLYEIRDDPLFQQGEQSILFLHQYSPGYYAVQGGPSGRFTVQNGKVSPINNEGIVFSTPLSETDFLTEIQNA